MISRFFTAPLLAGPVVLIAAATTPSGGPAGPPPAPTFDNVIVDSVFDDAGRVDDAVETPAAEWTVRRVAGEDIAPSVWSDGEWRSGPSRIDTPLPDGYPAPTPPGTIEIKRYPEVRRAQISGRGSADRGQWMGFWPLFQHIKSRDIAMTSPVEMDYRGEEPGGAPAWTMSFLYRTADLGPTGTDGDVLVVDMPARTFISIGLRGPYGTSTVSRGLDELRAWLDGQDEWVADGDPRALYYNDPSVRDRLKWSEAQIPVREATPAAAATEGASAGREEAVNSRS